MNVWSSHPSSQHMEPVSKHADAHAGWIWSLASQDDLLISGAWDSCVKFWKVGATGLTPARDKAQLKTAVLCMDIHEHRYVLCFLLCTYTSMNYLCIMIGD